MVELPEFMRAKHGDTTTFDEPCTPQCEELAEYREWEAEQRTARMESLLERSNLPERFATYRFDSFAPTNDLEAVALKRARGYAENFLGYHEKGLGLMFTGAVGTGKTHLAVAVMHHLIEAHGTPCYFVTVPELMDALRAFERTDAEAPSRVIARAEDAEVLILDDLGAEHVTEWVSERMFRIINHRYNHQRPTIITSNIGPTAIEERLGPRVASRLYEMCMGVNTGTDDKRRRR